MKNKFALFILFLFFVFSGCAHTAVNTDVNAVADEGGYFHEEVLPNGLKVFAIKDPNAPLSVFQIWYDAGSINEQIGKTGLSHLLEHMMFKGTPRYGPKTFSKMIKRVGGIDNAGTSKDFVYYYQKLAPDRLHLSIELEADRMRNLIMDPEETLSERDVVMEERRLRLEDDPQSLVYEEVVATAFKNHPYRWPVIGWMTDLETITRDELMDYYRIRYVPNNAMIVVAGDIDINSIMAKIKKAFGRIPEGPAIKKLDVGEPEQRGEKRLYVKKEAELPYILSAYKAPNILQDDSYALEVLAGVFSGGKSARIYRRLIDKEQIALSAGAGYSSIQKYPYLFYLYATALPGKKIEDVEAALYEEVEKIKKTPPTEREVQKAKNQVEADFIMNQDSIFYQAMIVAQFELIGDWKLKDKYLEGIGKVTPEDVQRVAKKYLVEDQRTVGILIPIKNKNEKIKIH
ncbi:MAG TPA: insulinase family protein [Nitrospirae bacterium]|nr:protease 3 precursor [bacterium BMS3Abin06]HDH13156.1 insulinase family protein [Nitrospirota bacterium]HDZ03288.1 insulinase family protein [Nitrospirota bacterium]